MSKKRFVIDVKRCNGCLNCQIACKDEHAGNDWTPIAKPQPETGQFWMKLTQEVRGTVPKVRVAYRPHLCMHCDNAPCMDACPQGVIYKREDGLVIIDPVNCTGCQNCVGACPYEAIYFNEGLNIAQKCTGCAHLLDDGWTEPRCVDACPTGTLRFVDEKEADQLLEHSASQDRGHSSRPLVFGGISPQLIAQTKPRVSYVNLPMRFIGGTVYDPAEKEVIIGATCTLTEKGTGKAVTVETDDFGDFWFEGLGEGEFSLEIRMNSKVKSFSDLDTRGKDLNLGDVALV
jgi:tetrathionate reductase subunit B